MRNRGLCSSNRRIRVTHTNGAPLPRPTFPMAGSSSPGVIVSTTNFVEHPRLAADRIVRFAEIVARRGSLREAIVVSRRSQGSVPSTRTSPSSSWRPCQRERRLHPTNCGNRLRGLGARRVDPFDEVDAHLGEEVDHVDEDPVLDVLTTSTTPPVQPVDAYRIPGRRMA